MYQYTFCNDCTTHTTTFNNPTPGSGSFFWVISSAFPEQDDVVGSISLTYQGSGYFDAPVTEQNSEAICFSGNSTVQRDDGVMVPLKELRVGDAILAVDTDGSVGHSRVLAVPHGGSRKNRRFASFLHIHHSGEDSVGHPLEVTRNHLVLTCSKTSNSCSSCPVVSGSSSGVSLNPLTMLTAAQDVTPSMCVLVAGVDYSHWSQVISVSKHSHRNGLYSVVTEAAYPVVSGVAASPFATNHFFPHAFYTYLVPLISWLGRIFFGLKPDTQDSFISDFVEGFSWVLSSAKIDNVVKLFFGGVREAVSSTYSLQNSGGFEL